MAILFQRTHSILILIQFVIICLKNLSANAGCEKDGLVGEGNGISCKVIDHKIQTDDAPKNTSFDCITTLENSIVVYTDGDVTLECSAAFPLELSYDGVQPAEHINLEFFKRGLSFEPNPETDIYVASLHLENIGHVIWSANYIFHKIKGGGEILMMSVFVEKPSVPWFLPLGDGPIMAYLYPSGSHIILPCRVQNYDSDVILYKDYDEIELDENIEFDPRKGFIRKILEDDDIYGEYECYIKKGEDFDRQKVLAVQTDSPVDTSTTPRKNTKDYGQLKFIQVEDGKSMAMCMTTKEQDEIRKTKGNAPFVNAIFSNPGILRLKAACLYQADEKTGRHCPKRKLGNQIVKGKVGNPILKLIPFENVTEHDNVYEIHPVHPEGGIQCGHNRKQYFTGTDKKVYFSYNVAAEKKALVKVQPLDEISDFITNGWYGFNCTYVSYVLVMPVWWKVRFSDGNVLQEFATNSSVKYFELGPDVVQVGCSVSAWNTSEWFESTFDIHTKPEMSEKLADSTKVYFQLDAKNQVLPCKGTGTPNPDLKWLKNGGENGTLNTTLEGNTLLLIFSSVTKDDEAEYTCVAHSETATIEVKFFVSVGEETGQDELAKTDDRKCVLVPTLQNNGTSEEIKDLSSIQTGDIILVRLSPNCSQDGLVELSFTATVRDIQKNELGSPEEIVRRNDDAETEGIERKCSTFFSLHSVKSGEEILPNLIKEGDIIFIRVSEKNCTDGQSPSETTLSVAVAELEHHSSEPEEDMPFSKTVASLIFVFFCILLIVLISLCACYCMDRPHKIYHVNK